MGENQLSPTETCAESRQSHEYVKPVFISVLLGRCYEAEEYSRVAREMSESFGNILKRPSENIHILFESNAMGRIAFGGTLLTDK